MRVYSSGDLLLPQGFREILEELLHNPWEFIQVGLVIILNKKSNKIQIEILFVYDLTLKPFSDSDRFINDPDNYEIHTLLFNFS